MADGGLFSPVGWKFSRKSVLTRAKPTPYGLSISGKVLAFNAKIYISG